MPQYTFKERTDGKVDIMENGASIAPGGSGFDVNYAKTLGYKPQAAIPNAPQLSPIQNPVPAASLSPSQSPQLPPQQAPSVKAEYITGLTADVQSARSALESSYKTQQAEADRKLADLKKQEQDIVAKQGELSQPFRQQLETAERDRLYINQNFEANQKLTNELETLLNEGNVLISGERSRFASRSAIAAGLARTIDDVNARAGVIQAVMSARNSQISQAYTMIDRSVAAITADRKDQLAYFDTLLSLNNQGQLKLDSESKALAEERTALLKRDLDRAEKTADAVKQAMLDPETALAYAEAGVTLLDTPEDISKKLAEYTYTKEVRDFGNQMSLKGYVQLVGGQKAPGSAPMVTIKDSRGVARSYYIPVPPPTAKEMESQAAAQQQARDIVTTVQDKINNITALLSHPGMKGTVGAYGIARWTPLTPDKSAKLDFLGQVQQLISQETLDTLINLKAAGGTLGALSDQEAAMLQQAASAIGFWALKDDTGKVYGYEIDEASFKRELTTIQTLAKRARDKALGNTGLVLPSERAAIESMRTLSMPSSTQSIIGKEASFF